MTTNSHTPLPFGGPLTSVAMEAPLSQLDAAISAVLTTGSGASTTLTAQANAGQKNLVVADRTNWVVGDVFWIGVPGGTFESGSIASGTGAGAGTLVAVANLANTYASGTAVSKSPIELVDARSSASTLKARLTQLNAGLFNVKASPYNAVGDGVADDTTAIQAAITAAFNAPGGVVVFPAGTYKVTATLVTPANTAGAVALLGLGRVRSFTGGVNGDPSANQGVTINYTPTTGDIFLASVTSGNKRQYITIDNIYFQGNSAGTTGHGLHFQATVSTVAVLVSLKDVTVNGAKQHGIFFDGNVFESTLIGVRISQCGGRGFIAALNGGGIPGETRFLNCSFNQNLIGCDLTGGGHFSYHGLTCSNNTNEGIVAGGVVLQGIDLQLEANGTAAGAQATFTSLVGATLIGTLVTCLAAGTGKSLSFVGSYFDRIIGLRTNSSVTGGGYMDIAFDATSSRCGIEDYIADDFIDRISLSTGGGYSIRRAGTWQSKQTHAVQSISSSTTSSPAFDATRYDCFLSTRTVAAITVTINPTVDANYQDGQRLTVEIFNNTAGATTTTWNAVFHLAGAWTDPAAGKTRTIVFEWNNARAGFFEVARAAADIT